MKFKYKREANIKIGQRFYGIIGVSLTTYDGIYSVVVDEIDWNKKIVIFKVNQPCEYVSCEFDDMECFVFETEEEAQKRYKEQPFGKGMYDYNKEEF